MKMRIVTAHAGADTLDQAVCSWGDHNIHIVDGPKGMLPAYQRGFELSDHWDIIAYLHDDLIIHDPFWHEKVLKEFEDPDVGLVGFGGATGHGDPQMYRIPYTYQQLARHNFLSNMRDAENHGKRFVGSCDVAVLDGFALAVRREVLEKAGGWPLNSPIGYVCYDYWLCCMVRRLGYRIRLVGVACDHLGGRTFVKLGVGKDPKHWQQYLDSHRYIYDEFKDVLPYRVYDDRGTVA